MIDLDEYKAWATHKILSASGKRSIKDEVKSTLDFMESVLKLEI